jgi:hypothetical protein
MNRRRLTRPVGLTAGLGWLGHGAVAGEPIAPGAPGPGAAARRSPPSVTVGALVQPDMVVLDLVGLLQTVFARLMATVDVVWTDLRPVPTDVGLAVPGKKWIHT